MSGAVLNQKRPGRQRRSADAKQKRRLLLRQRLHSKRHSVKKLRVRLLNKRPKQSAKP